MDQVTEGATSALAGSRELLETVLANLSDGIVVATASGERVYANEEAARLTGYATPEELLAAPPAEVWTRFQIVDEHGVPLAPSQLPGRRALAGEDDAAPKLVHFRSRETEEVRVSEVRAVVVRDERDEPVYAISLFREVTAEHRLAETLTRGRGSQLNSDRIRSEGFSRAPARDTYSLMAWLVVTSAVMLLMNLITDLLYGVLDPRINK